MPSTAKVLLLRLLVHPLPGLHRYRLYPFLTPLSALPPSFRVPRFPPGVWVLGLAVWPISHIPYP
eukprot:scaffold145606_cov35-Tisochrysis_lutea.AAC.4